MQVCTQLQTDIHANTPPLSFFAGRMPFLPPNQQRQSTEGDQSGSQCKQNQYRLSQMDPRDAVPATLSTS